MAEKRLCSIDGCNNPRYGRGWCSLHYQRWRRHGDPTICLTNEGAPRDFIENVAVNYCGDTCLIWPFSKTGTGYGQIWQDGRLVLVTRLICERVHGPAPQPTSEAAHNCGLGHTGCCNPRHLRWATPAENQADRIAHGTTYRGMRHDRAKLTESEVREIRSLQGRVKVREVANLYGVSNERVRRIQAGLSWAWLPR